MAEAELIRSAGNLPGQQESSARIRDIEGRRIRINSCLAASAEYAMYFTHRAPREGMAERIDRTTEDMFAAQPYGHNEDRNTWSLDLAAGNGIDYLKLQTWLDQRGIPYMIPRGRGGEWREDLRSWLRNGGSAIVFNGDHGRCVVYDENSGSYFEYEPNQEGTMTAERKELSPDMGSLWEIAMCLVPPTRDRMSPQMRRQIATHFGQIQEAQQQLFQNEFFPETANPARFSDNDEEFAGQLYRQALMMDGRFGKRNVSMLAAMTYDNHTTAEFRESWVNSGQLAATIEFMRRGNINNAVNFLYQFILDRQPDVGGRINYTRRLQNGDNVDDIIREMQRSGEYRQIAIRELYQDLLGREPDAPGLENKLRSGRSVDQIAAEIRGSEEYRRLELTDPDWPKFVLGSLAEHRGLIINDLVKDAFGTPKPNMMTFSRLVREFMAGAAVAETRSLIAGLPNYQRRIAELAARSPEDAVRSMFRLVLGREADPEGLRGYSAVIRRTNNPQAVLAELLHSEEYARMMINQLYHEILARDPDAGGLRDKAAAVRRGVSLGEIAADMRGSEEYRNKSRPPGVSLHLENRATRARLRRGDGIFHYRRDA